MPGIRNFLWVVQWFYKALGPLLGIFLTCNEGARGPLYVATSPVVVAQARRLRALQSRKGPYYNAGGYLETVGPQAQVTVRAFAVRPVRLQAVRDMWVNG